MRAALVTVVLLFTDLYQLRIESAVAVTVAGKSDEVLFNENFARCQSFKCGPPQPRVFRYQDVLDDHELSPCEDVRPHMTVLFRCDASTGYCPATKKSSCEAEFVEEVPLAFMITLKHTSGGCSTMPRKSRYVQTTAVNHTLCACQNKNNIK